MKTFLSLLSKQKNILLPVVFLSVFIAIVIMKAPLKQAFEYNPDEGGCVMGSLLHLRGFSLYNEIYSDQPPLFTVILSFWLKLFGLAIYHARVLILIFSGILLLAFYQTIKILYGRLCAAIAVLFLLLSAAYLALSISVMIGIPALSFAMLSVYFITLYKKVDLKRSLVLSGIFMALSLQTKLFTVFLVPIIILEIAQVKKRQNRLFHAIFLWFASFITAYLAVTIIFFRFNLPMLIKQLIQPHLASSAFNAPKYGFLTMRWMFFQDYDIIILALIGILLLIRQKKWRFLLPVLWLVLASVLLCKHRPVWHHYYLLLSIPLCWLAAIGFTELFRRNIRQNRKSLLAWITGILLILIIIGLPFKYDRMSKSLRGQTTIGERSALELISKYKKDARWIFTDRPIFAFYANILIPPELAIMSNKRRLTKNLNPDYLMDILEKYKPELVLLGRFQDYDQKMMFFIEKNYLKAYYYKPQTGYAEPYPLPSYRGKVPFFRWLNYFLWRYKLTITQAAHYYNRPDMPLTLYILKNKI